MIKWPDERPQGKKIWKSLSISPQKSFFFSHVTKIFLTPEMEESMKRIQVIEILYVFIIRNFIKFQSFFMHFVLVEFKKRCRYPADKSRRHSH